MKTLTEISQEAQQVLVNRLGIANTLRYLNQFSQGHGDYTKERHCYLEDIETVKDISSEARKLREQNKSVRSN